MHVVSIYHHIYSFSCCMTMVIMYCLVCNSYIDLEKVESVEEVSEPQSESGNRAGFHVVCGERTFEMEADNDETRKR